MTERDGSVGCWGANLFGKATPPDGRYTQVVMGMNHGCGLRVDATVACWGLGLLEGVEESFSLGPNDYDQAAAPDGTFTSISAGQEFTCGVRTNGDLECWGLGSDPDRDEGFLDHDQSIPPQGKFKTVSAGLGHACAIAHDDTVTCWGGPEKREPFRSYGHANAPEGTFRSVSAGNGRTCGVTTKGKLMCWGEYNMPASHANRAPDDNDPEVLLADETLSVVSVRDTHGCAISESGELFCWGHAELHKPAPSRQFDSLVTSGNIMCAVATDNDPMCLYLSPPHDQPDAKTLVALPLQTVLGAPNAGSGEREQAARKPLVLAQIDSVHLGRSRGTTPDGEAVHWRIAEDGRATEVQVAEDAPVRRQRGPSPAKQLPSAEYESVSATDEVICGLKHNGAVDCMMRKPADGERRILITGRENSAPTRDWFKAPSESFDQISLGAYAICGITRTKQLICWGDGAKSKLIGLTDAPSGRFKHVSVGTSAACALREDGTPVCWGARSHPDLAFSTARAPSTAFTDIEVGQHIACGLDSEGHVFCWGSTIDGVLQIPGVSDDDSHIGVAD